VDAIVKGESLRTVLKGIESDLARIIVRRAITEPLANAVGGLNLGNVFGSFFSGLFGGAGGGSVPAGGGNPNLSFGGPRAAGGPVALGSWYLVGERGPEPFIPTVPGQILPTESLRGMGGGGTSVVQHITVDARGADAGVDQKIRAAVAIGMEQANARLLAQINRGGAVAKTVGRRA
jgi:phage-related minor tail protein